VYELATGVRPFAGHSVADLVSAILRDDALPLTSRRAELPEDLDRIVGRCLEKIPRARFQTALDVANELRGLRRGIERGVLPSSRPASGTVASVAVLPFVNRSANPDDEYFSDGLADELINMLAKIQGLRVAARTSAFRFKGKHEDVAVIGEKLNVATLLEGSVRKAGSRVRISVQLVKVSDGYPLWSEAYDRMLDDIFAVQDDIAHSVVKELRKTLLGEDDDSQASGEARAEVAQAARGRGTHPQAHRLYLQARHLMERLGRADIARSIEYLKNALELDPEFALAWAELATQYSREADTSWVSVADGYGRACAAAQRALVLEPDLPEAHAALAWVQMTYDWDWRGAEISFARALERAPGNAAVVRRAGGLAWSLGRAEQALALYRRAVELDPLSASTYHNLGVVLNAADRNVESEDAYRKALDLAPQKTSSHGNLSLVLLAMGREDEALREAEAEPLAWSRLRSLAIIRHALGDRAGSDRALAELIETCANDSAYQIAEVYGMRSASDEAFAWLERAHVQRDGGLTEMKLSPPFRALHGDPRWSAFMTKMGFEDSAA
jgi:serine/threonine-protein kinase